MEKSILVELAQFTLHLPEKLAKVSEDTWNLKELRKVSNHLLELSKEVKGNGYQEVKGNLVGASRTMEGLIEGYKEKELSRSEVIEQLATLTKKWLKPLNRSVCSLSIQTEEKPHKFTVTVKPGAEVAAVLDADEEEVASPIIASHVANASSDSKITSIIQRYSAQAKLLPSVMTKPFNILTAPIVPIADADNYVITKPETLRRAKIKAVILEGYCILDNQLLLSVDENRIEKMFRLQTKIKNYDDYIEAYLNTLIDLVNESLDSRRKMEFMSEDFKRKGKVIYHWIMPRYKREALIKASSGSPLNLWAWDFPTVKGSAGMQLFEEHLEFGKQLQAEILKLKKKFTKQEAWLKIKSWYRANKGTTDNKEQVDDSNAQVAKITTSLEKVKGALAQLLATEAQVKAELKKLTDVDLTKFKGYKDVIAHRTKLKNAEKSYRVAYNVWEEASKSKALVDAIRKRDVLKDTDTSKFNKVKLAEHKAKLADAEKVLKPLIQKITPLIQKRDVLEKAVQDLRAIKESSFKDDKLKAHEEKVSEVAMKSKDFRENKIDLTHKVQSWEERLAQATKMQSGLGARVTNDAKAIEELKSTFLKIWSGR